MMNLPQLNETFTVLKHNMHHISHTKNINIENAIESLDIYV